MAKKITTGKISDNSKKKEIEKKIRKALTSSGKVVSKKKETRKVTRKQEQKAVPKKIKEKVMVAKKSAAKQKKAAVKAPEKKKAEKVEKKQEKKLPKVAKTAITRKKPEKPEKKLKTKTEIKATKTVKAVIKKKKQLAKAVTKVSSKIKKEVPARKKRKIDIPKPPVKFAKRVQAKVKPSVGKKTAKPAKKEKKVIKIEQKVVPAEISEAKKVRVVKTVRKAAPLKELKEKGTVREGAGEIKTAKELYPETPAEFPPVPWETLPSEYGENAIILMMVNPYKLFVFWEVREDTLKVFKGVIQIRVYDITGIDFDREDANSFFDLPADHRIGKQYIDVVPEREYLADIGIIYEGIFITIARSGKVLTPRVTIAEEGKSFPGFVGTAPRVGY